jgi:hypothetical protein
MFEGRKRTFPFRYLNKTRLKSLWIILLGLTIIMGPGVLKASAGSISGSIVQDCGSPSCPPVVDNIQVEVFSGNPCGHHDWITSVQTSTGNYSTVDLVPGDYWLKTNNMNLSNWVNEWWADPDSTFDCNGAEPVTVSAVGSVSGIDFQLDLGGSILGNITHGIANPIQGLHVGANQENCMEGWAAVAHTDVNGDYAIRGIPEGIVYVKTCGECVDMNYVNEWWDSADGTNYCAGAVGINVTPGQEQTGVNFSLAVGVEISGAIYDSNGSTLITDQSIHVGARLGDPCGYNEQISGTNPADGLYTIKGVPPGVVYLVTHDYRYMNEWWTGYSPDPSSYFCEDAQPIPFAGPDPVAGKDFHLLLGGSISGLVTEQGSGTPIPGIPVDAFSGKCHQDHLGGAETDDQGSYTIWGLLAGDFYVNTCPECGGQNFFAEWWDGPGGDGTNDCNQAESVIVTAEQETPGIDFSLEPAGSVSGSVLDADTGEEVEDSSTGSIELGVGWHKFVYRHHEAKGDWMLARAAFKGPGPTEQWDLVSTEELDELHVAPDLAAPSGLELTNKRYTCWNYSPRNHQQMVQCVDEAATAESGWYGQSVVNEVNHDYNIHGNEAIPPTTRLTSMLMLRTKVYGISAPIRTTLRR